MITEKYVPQKGDILYSCHEHLYYPELDNGKRGLVETEFVVTEEIVCSFFDPPKNSNLKRTFTTLCNITETGKLRPADEAEYSRNGLNLYGATPTQWTYPMIGNRIFRTPKEAALVAQHRSDHEDRHWNMPYGKEPCRRSQWEKYLTNE